MRRAAYCSLVLASLWVVASTLPLIAAPCSIRAVSSKRDATTRAIDIDDLFQHWVRSYEEERPGDEDRVFRPAASWTFPPSRFRMAYRFSRNGGCDWYFLSPDDNHRFRAGQWKIDPSDKTVLHITADGTTTAHRITALSGNLLRLRPLKPKPVR